MPFGSKIIFRCRGEADFTVAAELCEDLWVPAPPSVSHALAGANIIVNLSASDETAGKAEYRRLLVRAQSAKTVSGYVYADAGDGESTTDMVFSGHDLICENGEILAESALFSNGILLSEIDVRRLAYERRRINTFYDASDLQGYEELPFAAGSAWEALTRPVSRLPFVPAEGGALDGRAELILSMQAAGLKKRLEHTRAETAVLGISGGLDSALALLVCARAFDALGRDRKGILAVTMPCFGTTDRTFQNSLRLMEALGVTSRTVPVADAVRGHFKDIGHDERVQNAAYENAQARTRTLVLMDLANDANGLVVGTGDLSELALGWATYNGDHMSMYGVNASVPKTLVKYLIRYEAARLGGGAQRGARRHARHRDQPRTSPARKDGKIAQKTEEFVGPYELHDFYPLSRDPLGLPAAQGVLSSPGGLRGQISRTTSSKNGWSVFTAVSSRSSSSVPACPDGVKVGSVALSPRGGLADAFGRVGGAVAGRARPGQRQSIKRRQIENVYPRGTSVSRGFFRNANIFTAAPQFSP